jgi:hypothetical protein
MATDITKFTEIFDKITYGKSEEEVFDDFLTILICCLSGERYEDEYLSIVSKYTKETFCIFPKLAGEMVNIMDNDGRGLTDCLGEFFTSRITKGRNGQFFTPIHITDFMGMILLDENTIGKKVFDPACGSGRMLLSAAKVSRRNRFYGADIDHRCCKMTAINFCLNRMIGEVAWMDTLKFEHWGGYTIFLDETRNFIPAIKKLQANEGYIYNNSFFTPAKKPVKENETSPTTQIKLNL